MYNNNRNSFGDNPGMMPAPGGADPNFGMQWQGNNQMMMPPMMQPMMPGMMPGYNMYGGPQQEQQTYQPMMPPPMPPNLLGTQPPEIGPGPNTNLPRVNPTPNVQPPTPGPGFIGPVAPIDEAPPNLDIPMELNAPAENIVPANTGTSEERRKQPHSRSPNRSSNGSGRDRKSKFESDNKGGDSGQGRQHDRSGGRRDERRRSRSRDRSRRDRGERRSKWDSDKESRGSRGPEGMMVANMPPPGNMGAPMYPGNMFPGNIEMMGQAQMEMMKGGMMNPAMNPMMGGMMMDPSMMGMQGGMYPMCNQPLVMSAGVLEPPYPGTQQPPRRARPPNCRTVFVGGLPDAVREDTIKEIFGRFGKISSMRLKKGFCHVRFAQESSVEASFSLAGYRLLLKNQSEDSVIASGLLIDYALNRDDQQEADRERERAREPTPPRVEHITAIASVAERIKTEDKFAEAVPTLIAWLESGECSKKNANTFYSMIQATNNHTRRLMNDKMAFDEEFQDMKDTMKEKAFKIINQLEHVVKVLNAANHKRVWDHFTKLQRKNVETWYKMSEELVTVKEEFCQTFNDDDLENTNRKSKAQMTEDMYNEIKIENENLMFELEACKNEVHVAKTEAAREFEKFKAHFIAEQALLSAKGDSKMPMVRVSPLTKPPPPPPLPAEYKPEPPPAAALEPGEARLVSVVSMFLVVHPVGASLDYILSYVRSLYSATTQATLLSVLQKHADVFAHKITGVGANMELRWSYVPFARGQL